LIPEAALCCSVCAAPVWPALEGFVSPGIIAPITKKMKIPKVMAPAVVARSHNPSFFGVSPDGVAAASRVPQE
jgi:hypothetical protein